MGLFAIISGIRGLVLLNTITTSTLAAASIYDHREQLANAASTVIDSTKRLASSTVKSVKRIGSSTVRYVKHKLDGYEPHYGYYHWSAYD